MVELSELTPVGTGADLIDGIESIILGTGCETGICCTGIECQRGSRIEDPEVECGIRSRPVDGDTAVDLFSSTSRDGLSLTRVLVVGATGGGACEEL